MRTRRAPGQPSARSRRPSKLANVVEHPAVKRKRAPRTLSAAVDCCERDMWVVLRRKPAEQLGAHDTAAHALAPLIRQFRDVAERIRAIDAKLAEDAAAQDDDDLDDDEAGGWDDVKI